MSEEKNQACQCGRDSKSSKKGSGRTDGSCRCGNSGSKDSEKCGCCS